MSYSSNSFLKPIGSDKNIKFYDNTGSLTYTVKPTFITDVIDEVNLLKVILKSSKEIKLDFINTDEPILAKSILLEQISTLLQTNDYVDNSQPVVGYTTASYSYDTFLRPLADSDRNIKILGIDLVVKYTIDPFTINNTNVSGNLIKINLKSNRIITLEFSTSNEAKMAHIRLREQIDILTLKTPFLIDKDVQNYVTNVIDVLTTGATFSSLATSDFNLIPITTPLNPTGGSMYYDGTHSYIYTNNDWRQLDNLPKDPNVIYVKKIGGDFISIKVAVDSITDSSDENRYLISVGPGIFEEDTIDFGEKSFISVVGSDIQITQVVPNTPTQHLFICNDSIYISHLTIMGVGPGYAAIVCEDLDGFALIHKLSMYDCDTMVLVRGINKDTSFFGEYIDFNGEYSYGMKVESENGILAFANCENYYTEAGVTGSISNWISGENSSINVSVGSTIGDDSDSAFYGQKGADINVSSFEIINYIKGFEIGNVGTASKFTLNSVSIKDCDCDFFIKHPNTFGTFQGSSSHAKIVNDSPNIFWSFLDINDGEFDITRKISITYPDNTHTDLSTLIFEGSGMGVLTGGEISTYSGLTISIASGYGYLESNNHNILRIDWSETLFEVADNSAMYIYINENSNFSQAAAIPNTTNTIVLGRVITNNGEVILIDRSFIDAEHISNKLITFNRKALGPIYERGSIVTEGATFSLNVSRGSYYFGSKNYMPYGNSLTPSLGITFSQFVLNGTDWTITDTNIVTNLYDDGTNLVGMSASYYTKHTLYVNGEGDTEKYLLVVGQQQYEGAIDVEGAPLPIPPNYFEDAIVPIASIIIQEGLGTIYNILDIRPVIGFKSTGINASSTHANLQGLLADDHPQYLRLDGLRPMENTLKMGSQSIIGVLDVNGVTIESHASRHLPNGGPDPLPTGVPFTIGTDNQEGDLNAFARQDHIHAHGDQLGGTLHATASHSSAGFMSSVDKVTFDNIPTTYISKVGSSSQLLSATGSIINIGAGLTMSISGTLSVIAGVGATGATGATGAAGNFSVGFEYLVGVFSATNSLVNGTINFSTSTPFSTGTLFINTNDINGTSLATYFNSIATTGSAASRGTLMLSRKGNSSIFAVYNITAITNLTTHRSFSATYLTGNGTFNQGDPIILSFDRTGSQGATGSNGINGTNGAQGPQGPAGPQGLQGNTGAQGPAGPQGPEGPAGTGGSSFVYEKTLFVDPNGDDTTAIIGRIDLPWQTIQGAIQKLQELGSSEELIGYTIWVFPGEYIEDTTWEFTSDFNKTTIKLNGGVSVIFDLKGNSQCCISGNNNFSIVGDDRSISGGLPNVSITCNTTDELIKPPTTLILITAKNKQCRISNVSLLANENRNVFFMSNADEHILHITNTYMYSLENNILLLDGCDIPKISIINSILVNGIKDSDRQWANINTSQNFLDGPGYDYFNAIWNFENVRFVSYCLNSESGVTIDSENGHIVSNNLNKSYSGMYVILSNCKFYCHRENLLVIWFEKFEGGGINTIEILGTSLTNSNAITNIGGIVYLGNNSFIVQANIIDPTSY